MALLNMARDCKRKQIPQRNRDVNSGIGKSRFRFGDSQDLFRSSQASNVAIVSIRRHRNDNHGFVDFAIS